MRIVRDLIVKNLSAGLTLPMTYLFIYLFFRSVRGAQTRCLFGPAARVRTPIFNLSRSDIHEEILDSSF